MTYFELLEECKNIYTELSYNSRFTRIAMFHLIGRTVIENDLNPKKSDNFAIALGIKPIDLTTAIVFAGRYPNLDDFPHDKTISWSQVRDILNETEKT